jgi:hypothetical protein
VTLILFVVVITIFSGCEILQLNSDCLTPGTIWISSNPDIAYKAPENNGASFDAFLQFRGQVYPVHIGYRSNVWDISSNSKINITNDNFLDWSGEIEFSNKNEIILNVFTCNILNAKFKQIVFKQEKSLPSWAKYSST